VEAFVVKHNLCTKRTFFKRSIKEHSRVLQYVIITLANIRHSSISKHEKEFTKTYQVLNHEETASVSRGSWKSCLIPFSLHSSLQTYFLLAHTIFVQPGLSLC
jgi:hypothetical protein